ncbi:hypothetical protein [Thalassotalea sp. Y01]|uniref:hypothetical protein n=1 Tax=Thalassotalea sp. Y01 TaxID=2729613 RepID=UPI0017A2CAC6|nr:hypothetical protein [Thalassotalea sp. Y01]NMP16655.1 hypothetical protein [Thalassotalea sp. Y01]
MSKCDMRYAMQNRKLKIENAEKFSKIVQDNIEIGNKVRIATMDGDVVEMWVRE